MSFYKDYIKERENFEVLEHPHGFATYNIVPKLLLVNDLYSKVIYLKDIYIKPEMRRSKVATEIADAVSEIGIAEGCHKMIGSVCLSDPNVTQNLKVILSYSFSFLKIEGNLLFFIKEL